MFLKFCAFLLLTAMAIYYKGVASFDVGGSTVDVHFAVLIFFFGFCLYFYGIIKKAVCRIFFRRSKYEKGLDNLQLAFSGILLKDKSKIEKFIGKAEKYLGNIPIVSWIKGQQSLINGDEQRAKAIFYSLCERESDTALGAYSLCQLATKERSDGEALMAINSLLKVSPRAQDLILQATAISVKNKNFAEAKKHLSSLARSDKSRLVEAAVYSEEGFHKKDPDLLKKAFKLAPELSNNAVNYAELLLAKEEYRNARDVLSKSFRAFPHQKVFDKYISAGHDLSNLDKIKLANKLIDAAPKSWIGYFGLAKLLVREEMLMSAFQNLLTAYEKEPLDFIANELRKVAEMLDSPKPPEAVRILSQPLKSKRIDFIWKCTRCGAEENDWTCVCKYCNGIAEYTQIQVEIPLLIA
ncbi:MAG: hypothetical protein LBO02_01575 [Holosporaceae bacterium]|nr:hypothetical protein [Holosporaceae bacterium]